MSEIAFAPARSKINFRLIVFLTIAASPFLWIAYAAARNAMNGGIEDKGSYKLVDLKALGFFNFDGTTGTINDVPARFRKLDGQRVALDGYMYAGTEAGDRVKDFELVWNVAVCCFGGQPRVQERVFAHCAVKAVKFGGPDMVRLVGVLHVDVKKDAGIVTTVYTIDVENVEPL